ncbi:uncharacterized protein N7446_009533 [Penicillium canescens]|uniref:uncharacterized protein n=1 Tax=Penicillium canescens TaxID=5083 RepID=UPI0026DF8C5C|nr:uncharacterized protein N7446_009533 [Penicillium canescens]KAJ6053521.1 hypothetical protein N7446_009533 [Penicillium canescens]
MEVNALPDFQMLPYPAINPQDQLDNQITLKTTSSWTYCGPLLSLDAHTLPGSFNTWAEATINGSILPSLFSFLTYVHEFLSKNNQAHYWLTIRASKATHEFDIPRWHTDDLFFAPPSPPPPSPSPTTTTTPSKRTRFFQLNRNPNPPNWKLTTTLLGPGTLFIPIVSTPHARTAQKSAKQTARAKNPDHMCLSIRCIGCAMAAESVRATLATQLAHDGAIVQAARGQCVFFRVGEEEGAVHSEPMSHSDRVFVNVVPGSERDLAGLMGKWGMEFPRAWCVGLSFDDLYLREGCLRDV